ncbi:MAG TPA: hypothetical protein PK523_07995 [Elusimicrobiales bacterium]|nr:hypothetical protein [Elusimicrobiales bacterium]
MARKNRKRADGPRQAGETPRGAYFAAAEPPDGGEISRPGWLIIALSVLIAAAGYFLLSKAAPEGRDIYSNLSPFVILAGYAGVAVGIMWPAKRGEGGEAPASGGEKSPA